MPNLAISFAPCSRRWATDVTADETYAYVGAFVAELAQLGVRHVCLCPGSRSTPLALSFARHGAFRLWVHLDERSAAYFGLGLARATGDPVVLVCTSGTAAANFLPAIVEACFAHVPLVACTADRPPELHHLGANQTIHQADLYGKHVRLSVQMPIPEDRPELPRHARRIARQAVATSTAAPAGPIHLNFPFREPLVPEIHPGAGEANSSVSLVDDGAAPALIAGGVRSARQPVSGARPAVGIDVMAGGGRQCHAGMTSLASDLRSANQGLMVCGPQPDPAFPAAVARLAGLLHFPILADPLSGVRCGPHHGPLVLDSYDAFLRDACFAELVSPDLIMRFGAAPTSKPLLQFLERQTSSAQVVVGDGEWADPSLSATRLIDADPTGCCGELIAQLEGHAPSTTTAQWTERWQQADGATRAALDRGVARMADRFEGRVFTELATLLPDGATCVAGNSMPVRDLDTFFPGSRRLIRFIANRGASGIDGVISTALGVAAAGDGPVVLVVGDLSFYHDMNGLLAARKYDLSLTIILVNNDGGGIFSFLPQAAFPEHFEQLFGTPHGLSFAPAAELYGASYCSPATWSDFGGAVSAGLAGGGLHIVEVRTDRDANVRLHRALWTQVSEALTCLVT